MARKVAPKLPRGMRDILPQKMILRQYVIKTIQQVFEEFGFEPLQTPAVELEATLKGKYGPDAERLIYDVAHRGGREKLALRYDLSVPLCRVVAQYPEMTKPFKRYQIAPVWRAERPQKGRYREFYQCDADTVGTTSMLADAEIIGVTYEILTRLGFDKFVVNVNDRKIITGIGQLAGVPDTLLGGLYRSIDKLDKIGLEGVRAELGKALIPDDVIERLLEFLQTGGSNGEILAQLRRWLADYPTALAGVAELEEMTGYLQAMGIPETHYQIKPAMVRGLEYYTGPVYETIVQEPNIGSITGGGRYDELVGMFANRSYPAVGTTIGIERIIDVMEELKMSPSNIGETVTQVLATQFNPDTVNESLKLARELRQAGLNTELYMESRPLGKQIRYALKKGIPYVAIVGPDEITAGRVTLRHLKLKQQTSVPRDQAATQIEAWQNDAG